MRTSKWTLRSWSFLLLLFYITGGATFEFLHQALHSHESFIAHTESEEQDPCHRSIYHHADEEGCGHASHLVEKNKCDLCDSILHRDEACPAEVCDAQFTPGINLYLLVHATDSEGLSAFLPSRAPPVA